MPAFLQQARTRWDAWSPERYPRLARGKHSALLFAICLVSFVAYRLTAVPLIEPPRSERSANHSMAADPNFTALESQRRRLAVFFKPGEWELDQAKVLETGQGMLIFKDYKTLGDGRVELRPCTVLLLPNDHESLSDEEKARRAVLMRVPEGAELQFVEFNIRMARVGKLIGGELKGEITIQSDQREPGPEDDLLISTRSLVMTESEIHTDAPVRFRLGQSYGSGRLLRMNLLKDNSAGGTLRGPNIGGIRDFRLERDVKLHLSVDGLQKDKKNEQAAKKSEPPIEITSRGPFEFDATSYTATFRDHVDVLRVNESGPSDQLLCETLRVHFTPKLDANGAPIPPQDGKLPKLEPGWITALGSPVLINAPSSKVSAQGEELVYDLRAKNGALKAVRKNTQVKVIQERNEVHAREIHFAPGATKEETGKFMAIGPGWLKGTMPEDPTKPIEARWSKQAHFRPDKGEDVLSVTGRAYVSAEASGSLAADEIHVYLRPAETLPDGKKGKPTPRKLHALGAVEFGATQLDGHVQQLDVFFEKPGGVVPASFEQPVVAPSAALPSVYRRIVRKVQLNPGGGALPNLLAPANPGEPLKQRFDVRGEHLSLLVMLEEPQARLASLLIEQNVEIREIPLAKPDEKPLIVRGDRVKMDQPVRDQAEVKVFGQPAHIEARGMSMESAQINLDQADNRVWTPGAGEMDVLVDRDLDGQPLEQPRPLRVTWRGNMEFDGLAATFREAVEARHQSQELHTQKLTVLMQKRIDFQKGAGGSGPGPDTSEMSKVAELRCDGEVRLFQYTYDQNKLTATRQLRTRDLAIDQLTGDITAHGPGTLKSTQLGTANPLMAAPGVTPAATTSKPDTINYLQVDFAESITGNLKLKEMTFHEQVRTIYGPVPDWQATLDIRRPAFEDDENRFFVQTDALTVRQGIGQTAGPPTVELEANGDTRIEGQLFDAWASRLTYDQSKELITLHGDGYTDATIWHKPGPGELPKETRAGTIRYSKLQQTVAVEDFGHLDFNDLAKPPKKK